MENEEKTSEQLIKEQYPQKTDKLFIDETDLSKGAWIKNPAGGFFLYSEGYKNAGKLLLDKCLEQGSDNYTRNSLVYPMIFNYRQYIELTLKSLIIEIKKHTDGGTFQDGHILSTHWNEYKSLLKKIKCPFYEDIMTNVGELIKEFEGIDRISMCFRYPVTKAPDREDSLKMSTIDLDNFKTVMEKLVAFFEAQIDMIDDFHIKKEKKGKKCILFSWLKKKKD